MIAFDNMPAPYRPGLFVLAVAILLSGCGGGGEEPQGGTTNAPPQISGSPSPSVQAGSPYSFQPTASDPEGAQLVFSIQNKPAWAVFSTTTGALSGTPGAGDAGTTANIVIQVSDGAHTASLGGFSLTVTAPPAGGSLRIDWTAPTLNTDGSSLTNLIGFRIHYGTSANALSQSVTITGAGIRTHTITGLAPGTYYFSVVALASGGAESLQSSPASGVVP